MPRSIPTTPAHIDPDADTRIARSSGNVFADLNLPEAGDEAIKARIAMRFRVEVERRALSQTKVAEIIGAKQPDVSKLMQGRVGGFSLSRMLEFMEALGNDVEITIRATGQATRGRRILKVA